MIGSQGDFTLTSQHLFDIAATGEGRVMNDSEIFFRHKPEPIQLEVQFQCSSSGDKQFTNLPSVGSQLTQLMEVKSPW